MRMPDINRVGPACQPAPLWQLAVVRRLALDRNELRRTSDRIEAWFIIVLLVAFLPLAGLATSTTVRWAHDDGMRALRAELPLRQVTAVVVSAVPANESSPGGLGWSWAPARWTAHGVRHQGYVPAVPGIRPGDTVRIWISANGQAQRPPVTASQIAAWVVLAATATPPAVAIGLWLAWLGLRCLLDWFRLAGWARGWSLVGPSWTR